MYGLMANMSDGSRRAIDDLCTAREMAFVVTDLESSTAQASASAAAFAKVQEIHDTVLWTSTDFFKNLMTSKRLQLTDFFKPSLKQCR